MGTKWSLGNQPVKRRWTTPTTTEAMAIASPCASRSGEHGITPNRRVRVAVGCAARPKAQGTQQRRKGGCFPGEHRTRPSVRDQLGRTSVQRLAAPRRLVCVEQVGGLVRGNAQHQLVQTGTVTTTDRIAGA